MSKNASDRRAHILRALQDTDTPLSASALAAQLGVSRQIIVGDVALLRASGEQIDATPRGYRLQKGPAGFCALVACRHIGVEALAAELYAVVENGGVLEDVAVDNPLYGQLTARLDIATRRDAEQFLARASASGESLLSNLTGGVHLHTIRCAGPDSMDRIRAALDAAGVLYRAEK